MYKIEVQKDKNRIVVTSEGEHDGDMREFVERIKEAAMQIKQHSPYFDILTDLSKAMVIQQDRAEASKELIQWCERQGMRKSAAVVDMIVQRMQVTRLTDRSEKVASFSTRAEAERWLDE